MVIAPVPPKPSIPPWLLTGISDDGVVILLMYRMLGLVGVSAVFIYTEVGPLRTFLVLLHTRRSVGTTYIET